MNTEAGVNTCWSQWFTERGEKRDDERNKMSLMRRKTDPSRDSGRHGAQDQSCCSFHWDKLILIVDLCLHLRPVNISTPIVRLDSATPRVKPVTTRWNKSVLLLFKMMYSGQLWNESYGCCPYHVICHHNCCTGPNILMRKLLQELKENFWKPLSVNIVCLCKFKLKLFRGKKIKYLNHNQEMLPPPPSPDSF